MAALHRGSSNPEISRPTSRVQRFKHERPNLSPWTRRPQNDERLSSSRNPSPHQFGHTPYPQYAPKSLSWTAPQPTLMAAPDLLALELPNGITMERTPSGNSIMSDIPESLSTGTDHTLSPHDSDSAAARHFECHFRRLPRKHWHERILRKLIHNHLDIPLDDVALDGILTAADTVFFDGKLKGRVNWEWSSHDRYRTELIGTTALRRRADGNGFETLIVLSEPILRDPSYDRRLLLSAFLHELIHCYLFIECGFEARVDGGHTAGFHRIAELIDSWVGVGYLSLCKLKEDPMRWYKEQRVRERVGEDWRPSESHMHLISEAALYDYNPVYGHEACDRDPPLIGHQHPVWISGPDPVEFYRL